MARVKKTAHGYAVVHGKTGKIIARAKTKKEAQRKARVIRKRNK